MYKKIIFSILIAFIAFIDISILDAEAKGRSEDLTNKEKRYLYETLNFSNEEVDSIPIEEAQFLIKNKAEVVSKFETSFDMSDAESNLSTSENFNTLGTISTNDLSFTGGVLKIQSYVSNYDAYYAYVDYKWLNRPIWRLTDKITIGYPTSLGVYIPTTNGKIDGHSGSHWLYNTAYGTNTSYSSTSTPSDVDPSSGVASEFNLHDTINVNHELQGRVSQIFYVKTSLSGKANVKFQYGHKMVSGEPSVSILPAGLSITPASNLDTREYYSEISY